MKKQNNLLLFVLFFLTAGCASKNNSKDGEVKMVRHNEEYVQRVNNGDIKEDDYEGSVYRSASITTDSLRVRIFYGSPGVRKRVIWGKLVPYDTVWVSGALKATMIEFSNDVIIGGKKFKPGKYAFFTIPGRKSWKIVFNTDYHQHNTSDYDIKKDLLRLDVVPDTLLQATQRLTYTLTPGAENDVNIVLAWEKLSIPFRVGVSRHK